MTVQRYDGPEAAVMLGAFLPAYREIYVEPPSCASPQDVADFTDMFAAQSGRPGFRVALARDAAGEVVGFAYGFRVPTDTGWWRNLLAPTPAEFPAWRPYG